MIAMDPSTNTNTSSASYFSLINFPYDGFSPNVTIGSSQVPFCSQPPNGPPTQSSETPHERRERRQWTSADDLVLISAWLNTSKDVIVGNDQRSGTFWKRIHDYYASSSHVLGGVEPRLADQCKQRWQKISKDVSKFCGAYASAEREKASGMNENDILKMAHQIYLTLYKKKFTLEHGWAELRYEQKWCSLTSMNPTSNTSSKKRKADEIAPSSGSVVGEHESRPPGIKAMKARRNKGSENVAPSSEFQIMWEIKEKDLAHQKELKKMAILDSLIAKKEPLDEMELALKKHLMTELF